MRLNTGPMYVGIWLQICPFEYVVLRWILYIYGDICSQNVILLCKVVVSHIIIWQKYLLLFSPVHCHFIERFDFKCYHCYRSNWVFSTRPSIQTTATCMCMLKHLLQLLTVMYDYCYWQWYLNCWRFDFCDCRCDGSTVNKHPCLWIMA